MVNDEDALDLSHRIKFFKRASCLAGKRCVSLGDRMERVLGQSAIRGLVA